MSVSSDNTYNISLIYKQIGNAVPVKLAEAVGEEIIKLLELL